MNPTAVAASTSAFARTSQQQIARVGNEFQSRKEHFSLSRYFPVGTDYFYSYPCGENSRFYNNVSPYSEELVSARSLVCAGNGVRPVVFAATVRDFVWKFLREELGVKYVPEDQVTVLPDTITPTTLGNERNAALREALRTMTSEGSLIMAQPYLDPLLEKHFQIRPERTIWLNDKANLESFVPKLFLPERYAVFESGEAFACSSQSMPIPCVVKVSSSSSGDGVHICRNDAEVEYAKTAFRHLSGTIIVEQSIDISRNLGVQFGVPTDPQKNVEIIGISEQLVTSDGEFIGGIVDPENLFAGLDEVSDLLTKILLPRVRSMGWYGVGGFDVLLTNDGRYFLADPNFRMTGMTPYLCAVRNGEISRPMVSFIGTFHGSRNEFEHAMTSLAREGARDQMLHIIALTCHEGTYRLNAAMVFDDKDTVPVQADALLKMGIESKALTQLSKGGSLTLSKN